jgi:ribosomal-protein-alanine N-acetyltransferase
MSTILIKTPRLLIRQQTKEEALGHINALPPEDRAQVSPAWLAMLEESDIPSVWIVGFFMTLEATGEGVGSCGFAGPPDSGGVVELAYAVDQAHRGQGYATEAADALARFALAAGGVSAVRAHTLDDCGASAKVLTRCGFAKLGQISHPEDGLVWRWEKS